MPKATTPTPVPSPEAQSRFWAKVDKSGDCWMWTAHRSYRGYGVFGMGTKRAGAPAHRVAWAIANNREVPPEMEVCHRCDVKACVNPDHLWLGTHAENMKDAFIKGRYQHKPRCALCKNTRREAWVVNNQAYCANCYFKHELHRPAQPRILEFKQLPLFVEPEKRAA